MPSRAKARDSYELKPQSEWHARLGHRLKAERERAGVSLRGLAGGIGRCYFTIRRHEAGEMMLRTDDLITAAKVLRVDPGQLLKPEDFDGPATE